MRPSSPRPANKHRSRRADEQPVGSRAGTPVLPAPPLSHDDVAPPISYLNADGQNNSQRSLSPEGNVPPTSNTSDEADELSQSNSEHEEPRLPTPVAANDPALFTSPKLIQPPDQLGSLRSVKKIPGLTEREQAQLMVSDIKRLVSIAHIGLDRMKRSASRPSISKRP